MMVVTVDFLLLWFLLTGVMIEPSKGTLQPNESKCLTYLDEVKQELGSKRPPIDDFRMTDNYYNISRALYPSINLPALYVKVTIQFLKDYQNGTKRIDDTTMKLTWSKACSYVAVKHISLCAMSVFSLGTIFPQRRETELTITVPPLCKDSPYASDTETTWRYIVSTLEDIAINSKISDPRINTVACVVQGHEGDKDQPIKYPNNDTVVTWDYCWFVFAASCLTSIEMWIYLHAWLKAAMNTNVEGDRITDPQVKKDQDLRIFAGTVLKMTVFTFIMVLTLPIDICFLSYIIHVNNINNNFRCYDICFLVIIVVITLIVCVIICKMLPKKIRENKCLVYLECVNCFKAIKCSNECGKSCNCIGYKLGFFLLFPCLFTSIHHFLWVLCGIISEPYWGTPIFLIECLFGFSVMYSFYLYEKDVIVLKDASGIRIIVHLILVVFAFTLILLIVVFVGHGHIVNVTTAGVIELVLTLTFMWLIKNSGLQLKSFNSNETEAGGGASAEQGTEVTPLTT